jgi:hypothetical protein
MAPPTKYSAEQIEFMVTFHNQFLECKANKNYEPFWNPFFEAWGAKFPECAVVFEDIPLDVDLTEEQSTVLAEAWALRQRVCICCPNINFKNVLLVLTMLTAPHGEIP